MILKHIIKTRFAPSPTGFTHIGNIRTALFSWLYAKKNNGKFFIRIDDTDDTRSSKIYVNNIFDTLNWLKLPFNENVIFQSDNYFKYKTYIHILLKKGYAYKCFCTKDRLLNLKESQLREKKKIRYDGFCKNDKVKKNLPYVIRFNSIKNGCTTFVDIVKGRIDIPNIEIDNFIIAKNNYNPTYNFASTIDDIDMQITDIIRGEDHISNTPRQIQIMIALNAKIPRFTHLPLILDKNRHVLSKRNHDISIRSYKENGILPEALLNYMVRLGWSYKDKEIFSLNEMIELFDINDINKSAIVIDKEKLLWLNRYYIKQLSVNDIFKHFIYIEKKMSIKYGFGPSIKTLIKFNKTRVNTLKEIITNNVYLYSENNNIEENVLKTYFSSSVVKSLYDLYQEFKNLNYTWTLDNIKMSINFIINKHDIKLYELATPLRILITGKNDSMPVYEMILITGRVLILKKIINIIKKVGAIAQIG